MDTEESVRVECRECTFTAVVTESDDRVPAEVVIAHGKESGHKLSVTTIED